jgi:hypothetical protein
MPTRYVRRRGFDLVGHVILALCAYAFVVYCYSIGGLLGFAAGTINLIGMSTGILSKGFWFRAK